MGASRLTRVAAPLLVALALSGCGVQQAANESHTIAVEGEKLSREMEREKPKVEQATREVEATARKAQEEEEAMKAKGE